MMAARPSTPNKPGTMASRSVLLSITVDSTHDPDDAPDDRDGFNKENRLPDCDALLSSSDLLGLLDLPGLFALFGFFRLIEPLGTSATSFRASKFNQQTRRSLFCFEDRRRS
jgi:hypothetical protein